LRLHHSGRYSCEGLVKSIGWKVSGQVKVTVQGVSSSGMSLLVRPPEGQVALSCTVALGTGPLSISLHQGDLGTQLGTNPRLELRHIGDNDNGHYQCRVSNRDSVAESPTVNITV
ncbi:FCRL2 protein, partial [Erithacus rubecula]|nr:FCRL2 protein [Erithacus rubecula]